MKTSFVALAVGATLISAQGAAQEHGGWASRDMSREQAKEQAAAMFQRFDVNHDGVVTRQEAEQAGQQFDGGRAEHMIDRFFATAQSLTLQQSQEQALARFDRDDLNHDGVVTAAERQQVRAGLNAARGAGQTPGQ